jgi:hypothetical protein
LHTRLLRATGREDFSEVQACEVLLSIVEVIIWGEQNEANFFEYLLFLSGRLH